jgi:hypothetical protein
MAAPSETPSTVRIEKYFKVPNEFAEHQHAFIPAERALALLIWRTAQNSRGLNDHLNGVAQITDQQWHDYTGLQPRMKELAIRGLKEKGLEVNGEGQKAKFSWNWNRWNNAFRDRPEPSAYDPRRKERDAAAAAKKVHPDCATGCAKLREMTAKNGGSNQPSALLVMPVAQLVAHKPKTATEANWPKTMLALRDISCDVGLALLKLILTAISIFGAVADGVLAAAVKNAGKHQSDRLGKYGVGLLVKVIPNILQTWKAKGMRLDVEPDEGKPPADERQRMADILNAKKILADIAAEREVDPPYDEADIQWARDTLASSDPGSSRETETVRQSGLPCRSDLN